MKKNKKIILAILIVSTILLIIGLLLANPDLVDSKEEIKVEVPEEVIETQQELEDEIFD